MIFISDFACLQAINLTNSTIEVEQSICPYGCNFDILYPIAHIRLLEFEKLHFWHTIIKIAKNSIMLHAWFWNWKRFSCFLKGNSWPWTFPPLTLWHCHMVVTKICILACLTYKFIHWRHSINLVFITWNHSPLWMLITAKMNMS